MDGVESIREVLSRDTIHLDEGGDGFGIFEHVDAFASLRQRVGLCLHTIPYDDDDASGTHRYAIWEKVAEGIGNLQALREITISEPIAEDDEEDAFVRDWEILACTLRRLQRRIKLRMWHEYDGLLYTAALPGFAEVIRGQAMITGFITGHGFPLDCMDVLCSALLTHSALEFVSFNGLTRQGPEEGQSLENLIKLLQSPTLREAEFGSVDFTNALSQAVAKVLKRSEITDLRFLHCAFSSMVEVP